MRSGIIIMASAACLAVAAPASATVSIVAGNVAGSLDTIHIGSIDPTNSHVVDATTQNGTAMFISSDENITPSNDGNGQPWVAAVDGALNTLTFTLRAGYTFSAIEFNLNPPKSTGKPVAYTATVTGVDPLLGAPTVKTLTGLTNNTFINVFTTNPGEYLTSVSFTSSLALAGVGQIRISAVNGPQGAVPEPASWAMMVGGFGLIGGAMRRKKASLSVA